MRSCSVASWPSMMVTGSPTYWNRTKEISATDNITPTACSSRRIMKNSMWNQRRLFDGDPFHRQPVISAVHHIDVLAHCPGNDLIVQRDMAEFLCMNSQCLADGFSALGVVGFSLDLVDELVDFRVGVTPIVERAVGTFTLAGDQALQGVERVEGWHAPTEKTRGGIVVLHLG